MKIKWMRPSGREIETNDEEATIEYCESMGWERMNDQPNEPEPSPESAPSDSTEPEESQR